MRLHGNITELLKDAGKEDNRPALIDITAGGVERWTYCELSQAVEEVASGLIGEGQKRGERIALIGENSAAWIIACLAVWRAGGVCVPIDTQFSDEQLRHALELSKPERAFISKAIAERIESLNVARAPQCILLDKDEQDDRHWSRLRRGEKSDFPEVSAEDTAVIFFTSGTTGAPKGVPLTHANLLHQLEALRRLNLVKKKDRLLLPLPLHHVYPFTIGMLAPLVFGVPIVFPGSLTAKQITQALKAQQITLIIGLPRLYRALLEGIDGRIGSLPWSARLGVNAMIKMCTVLRRKTGLRLGRILLFPLHRQFAPELKMLISGGAALDQDVAARLEGLGWKIGSGYGLTETSPLLTLNPPGKGHWNSAGKPVKDVEIRIAEPKEKEDVEFGEVLVKGPNVFKGYLDNPEKTEEAFTEDGWFRTGDLGKLDENGYLRLTGRLSTLIVTESGENIQPDQVEEAYALHPMIREIGVLERDNKLVAVVAPEINETTEDIQADISDALKEQARKLPSYQHLSGFQIAGGELPRTRLGKIRREKLKELYEQLQQGEESQAESGPIPEVEMAEEDRQLMADDAARAVWDMMGERYPKRRLTPDTGLALNLGVDSLEWLNLTLEIEDRSGVSLNEKQIAKIETIRDLLKAVTESSPSPRQAERGDPLEEPESILSEEQLRWLKPSGSCRRALARLGYSLNRLFFKWYFRLKIEGENPIKPDKPCLITPNHRSYLDPMALAAALDNQTLLHLRWAGWAKIMLDNPFMRFIARCARVLPVEPRGGAASSLAFGALALKQGEPLIWFPEGRRSRTGKLQRFQPGVGMLAEHFDVPIIPVYIEGTYEALPPGERNIRRHPVSIRFGKPLEAAKLEQEGDGDRPYERIINALHRRMKENLDPEKDRE